MYCVAAMLGGVHIWQIAKSKVATWQKIGKWIDSAIRSNFNYSLTNHKQFAKLSPYQTFLLRIIIMVNSICTNIGLNFTFSRHAYHYLKSIYTAYSDSFTCIQGMPQYLMGWLQ